MSDWRELQPQIYPWQQPLWQQWQQLWQSQRWHHALLLLGDQGFGAPQLAAYLAQALLCQHQGSNPLNLESCELCHSCRLFQAKNHPDIHWLAPLEGKRIGVEAVREANRWALETAQLGGQRVIVIEGADRLGESAANALLKTLEEPPANCQFILLAERQNLVLPTILSRCSLWRMTTINESSLMQWGQAQGINGNLEHLRLSHQAPLLWAQFDAQQQAQHQQLIAAFSAFVRGPLLGDWMALAQQISESTPQSFDWLSYLLLDGQKYQRGAMQHIVHCHHQDSVAAVALLPSSLLISQQKALHQLKFKLTQPLGLNASLLISDWLMAFIPS
ncbi:DNA polymerase III subunit delta' [Vibrio stylophorae]|uniref:DNA polymerase III subunit delta' n=1 Tax=Vibrio stylophorae TaxID=659351 RepID=A0ABM8ZRW1_9VIBR|nr:DNA polymerase III subunit delta' [Vibrio stylophorae]CAH0533037.1 DNA polymerase III subunit delta' [Vibrio stylophorae]